MDTRLERPIEDRGEPTNLLGERFPRGRPSFGEPGNRDPVVRK
jgi:hypothetical protein